VDNLRIKLEMQSSVGSNTLEASLAKYKIESIREILLFRRYEEFKTIIHKFMAEN
jgi:hypothetical protein